MTIADLLLPEYDLEVSKTRTLLALVPDAKLDFRPHPKSMPLGTLASHVSEIPGWMSMTLGTELLELGDGFTPFRVATTRELLESLDTGASTGRAALAAAPDEAMDVIWTLKWNGEVMVSQPRSEVVRQFVMNHLIHHRAQLGVYLRLLDVPIPGMYGASADDMAAMKGQ